MKTITGRLLENGIELVQSVPPVANYVQSKIALGCIFISGQLPSKEGTVIFKGKVGKDLTVEDGKEAAKLCMINLLNQLSVALEDNIDRVKSCLKLEIFVNCSDNFERHSEVANGASDLITKILGERGRHTRIAVGVNSLPFNSAVEVTAIFESTNEG